MNSSLVSKHSVRAGCETPLGVTTESIVVLPNDHLASLPDRCCHDAAADGSVSRNIDDQVVNHRTYATRTAHHVGEYGLDAFGLVECPDGRRIGRPPLSRLE
jgi:hypothetical protein